MSKRQPRRNESGRPKRTMFHRFDDFVMRFVGPANRSPMTLRGNTEMTEETRQWYQNLQNDYEMVRDANGHSYLRPRGPETGPPASPRPPR